VEVCVYVRMCARARVCLRMSAWICGSGLAYACSGAKCLLLVL